MASRNRIRAVSEMPGGGRGTAGLEARPKEGWATASLSTRDSKARARSLLSGSEVFRARGSLRGQPLQLQS